VTDASAELAYFWSDIDDVIVLVPSSINTFTPENISAATIRGQEVSLRAAFADRVLLTANYTHQNALDASGDPHYDGNQLPGRPAHEAYVRLELLWSHDRPLPIGWIGDALWPGRVFYDADLIADNFLNRANTLEVGSRALQGVGVDVALPWGGLRVAWELKNFTNDQTEDAAGFPLPGRSMFVTVSAGFGAPGAVPAGAREK
jgi:iron complex outermembrane receptor protein